MVAIGSYKPEIYKREEWELKQLREKTMKQNWEKELNKQFGKKISAEALHCINFIIMHDNVKNGLSEESLWKIARAIHQAKQEERDRILKALPKEKVAAVGENWDGKSGTFGAFNACLKQIKDIIKKL